MSTSDLYLLFGKSVRHWSEHRNGWGSAPIVWDYLGEKYIDAAPSASWRYSYKPVWELYSHGVLLDSERAALSFTFDDAYVPVAHFPQAADLFEQFNAQISTCASMANRANHWQAFADELRKAATAVKDKRCRGMCISCTSVNDVWSYRRPKDFGGEWSIFG